MEPSPSLAPTSYTIADHLSKPLLATTHQQIVSLIGAGTTVDPLASANSMATVNPLTTVVASAPTPASTSTSVPAIIDPNSVFAPAVLDTGASFSLTPLASDFTLDVDQAPYGLFRSPISVFSKALASTPVDPYALITGEDITISDLSSPNTIIDSDSGTIIDSDSGPSFTKVYFDIRQFGTSTLTFVFSTNLNLIKVFVSPTQVDWIHWVPLPRLILPESYFHIFGLDYLQAFALFHLIPIWIYYLLHLAVNLE